MLKKQGVVINSEAISKRHRRMGLPDKHTLLPKKEKKTTTFSEDLITLGERKIKSVSDKKYKELLQYTTQVERERDAVLQLQELHPTTLSIVKTTQASEATMVVMASDWHVEETVVPATVSGLNEYSLEISRTRISKFWQVVARLVEVFGKDIKIPRIVIWLGGDFITGNIHEELMEICSLRPIPAAIEAQNLIASGLNYILQNTDCEITVICSVGNHSRITKERRIATEQGNSLELFMYHSLADYFKPFERIKFILPEGYHSYLKVYDWTLRFHHGHQIKYQGGVGGIFVPAFKAIAQWNKARQADYDIFGHYHAAKDGGNFLMNGSIIGYNAYALSIKADFEKPRQMVFLIDSQRGKTVTAPIIL